MNKRFKLCRGQVFQICLRDMQFIPLPPEGSVATSLLTGKPAPSLLFNSGPSDGFSCHVNPSKLIAAKRREGERRRCEDMSETVNCCTWRLVKPQKYRKPRICLIIYNQGWTATLNAYQRKHMLNKANTQKAFRKPTIKIMSVFFSFFTFPPVTILQFHLRRSKNIYTILLTLKWRINFLSFPFSSSLVLCYYVPTFHFA